PAVTGTLESQFRNLTMTVASSGEWVLRAVCDEPVMDHALVRVAAVLNEELRTRRAPMSDFFARIVERGFPTVRAEVYPAIVDGSPRYTTPPVMLTLAPDHARRLFMGTDLWGDPALAYREL